MWALYQSFNNASNFLVVVGGVNEHRRYLFTFTSGSGFGSGSTLNICN
jgi:hypothetical protein